MGVNVVVKIVYDRLVLGNITVQGVKGATLFEQKHPLVAISTLSIASPPASLVETA